LEHDSIPNLTFFEINKSPLELLYQLCNEIYVPILHNPANQQGWTELISKDLMEKLNNFVAQIYLTIGQIKGRTMLPLPPTKIMKSTTISDKDKAHIFESSIITWSKQIRKVLETEPEQALKQGQDPDPMVEITFWENKSQNLNMIHDQLKSEKVSTITKTLRESKSTYTNQFDKLKREIYQNRKEANDNYLYLKTLEPYFKEMCSDSEDFLKMPDLFVPIMHTILLIWKNSGYYKTAPRLVVLIREICNAIINKAKRYISGEELTNMIQSKDQVFEACEKLQSTIDVCTKFKDIYFEYKAKADGQWKFPPNALFIRLDSFLERCHDILHITSTILQFNKLENIQIGCTKGKNLTETVKNIS
jgi:dynein heavy chain